MTTERYRPPAAASKAALAKRQARLDAGQRAERDARTFSQTISLQGLIEDPLLETLRDLGGHARPRDVYAMLATKLGLDEMTLAQTRTTADGQIFSWFEQQTRWARQTAIGKGRIDGRERGIWTLTQSGLRHLSRAESGQIVLVYRVDDGFALWARAEDAAGSLEPDSLKLIMTSPPYPSIDREYGRYGIADWLAWMETLIGRWKELLTSDGTLALNIGDVHVAGTPCLSPTTERLILAAVDRHGLQLASRLAWHSPSKFGHIEWACKRRIIPANRLEHVVLLSKSAFPDWDTTRLDIPARAVARTARTLDADAKRGIERRPTGKLIRAGAFSGRHPVPGNLIEAGGASGADAYARGCRTAGLPLHPARFPEALPRYVISLATRPGDTVYDPMAGSNTVGKVASDMGRRFIASDAIYGYVASSALRFAQRSDFVAAPMADATPVETPR